jgi:hypothetical protein
MARGRPCTCTVKPCPGLAPSGTVTDISDARNASAGTKRLVLSCHRAVRVPIIHRGKLTNTHLHRHEAPAQPQEAHAGIPAGGRQRQRLVGGRRAAMDERRLRTGRRLRTWCC